MSSVGTLHRRYLCRKCDKFYIRKVDYKKHCLKFHQNLILNPDEDCVTFERQSKTTHEYNIGNATVMLTNTQD